MAAGLAVRRAIAWSRFTSTATPKKQTGEMLRSHLAGRVGVLVGGRSGDHEAITLKVPLVRRQPRPVSPP